MIGVYALINTSSGKMYIGSSREMDVRIKNHFNWLQAGKHFNVHLQRAYSKDSFTWFVVEECDVFEQFIREQYWIDYFGMAQLYNLNPTALKPPDTTSLKMTDENRAAVRERLRPYWGLPMSPEARKKLSASRKGVPAHNKGKPMSETQRVHLSEVKKGRPALNRKPIMATKGTEILYFSSASEAAKTLHVSAGNITAVTQGKASHTGGWYFEYIDALPIE